MKMDDGVWKCIRESMERVVNKEVRRVDTEMVGATVKVYWLNDLSIRCDVIADEEADDVPF